MAVWVQPLVGSGPRHHPLGSECGFPCTHQHPTGLDLNPLTGWSTLLRHPFAQTYRRGTGLLTRCPSPTALALGLGPTNPTRITLPSETLDLRRTCFSHVSRYSCQHSHFWTLHLSSQTGFNASRTLPYYPALSRRIRSFGTKLSPVILSAQDH